MGHSRFQYSDNAPWWTPHSYQCMESSGLTDTWTKSGLSQQKHDEKFHDITQDGIEDLDEYMKTNNFQIVME